MAVSIAIGIALFAGLLALLATSYHDRAEGSHGAGRDHTHTAAPDADECLLCHAPLPHLGTADDAVQEIERRIASDRSAVAGGVAAGLPHPER